MGTLIKRTSGEEEQSSSGVDNGVSVVRGRQTDRLSRNLEVSHADDEPELLGDGGPLVAGITEGVTEDERATVGAEAHAVTSRLASGAGPLQERRNALPGGKGAVGETPNTINAAGLEVGSRLNTKQTCYSKKKKRKKKRGECAG
jgi:hypothetical protein